MFYKKLLYRKKSAEKEALENKNIKSRNHKIGTFYKLIRRIISMLLFRILYTTSLYFGKG